MMRTSLLLLLFCFMHPQLDAQTPGSCSIKAKVVQIIKSSKKDVDVCAKHPCKAKVKILSVYSCGSSVTNPPGEGNIIEVRFAYTLDATSKLFPSMKKAYPGLRKGNVFSADIEQRIGPNGEEFVIYGYRSEWVFKH